MYVSAEQLRDNDYVLSMNRYIVHDVADGMAFGDVIKRITRGAQLNAKALDEITTTVPTDMQYLMLAQYIDSYLTHNRYLEAALHLHTCLYQSCS